MRCYLPFIRKDSVARMHGFPVYVKEKVSFAQDISIENSGDSFLSFRVALIYFVYDLFFL